MELYLDSADIQEIRTAFELGFLAGLTTTPTFMHRHGITDIDQTILELAKLVPVLQIEALGETAAEIVAEAHRQDELGLDRTKTVYKIPASLEAVKACRILVNEGFKVNIHLVYTLQQAYMAMAAGANFVCPLVGRLQDQGHDALGLIQDCVEVVDHYGYDTKIMFSSVRHVQHVRDALELGTHVITAPWKIIRQLTQNHLTDIGTRQFQEHTRLMTLKVGEVMNTKNPIISKTKMLSDGLLKMTLGGFGAVTIIDDNHEALGIFTDGDLRRLLSSLGEKALAKTMGELITTAPKMIDVKAPLHKAAELFKTYKIDCLVVTDQDKVIGMLDIQDLEV